MNEYPSDKTRHYCIKGRVQGVFFRASTAETARALKLCGWVRNLPDGSVEALAQGSEKNLQAFRRWLQQGPPAAQVLDVKETDVVHGHPAYESFEIRR